MHFDAVLLAPRRAQMVAQGWWQDRTINEALDQAVQELPDKLALVAQRTGDTAARRFSYAELGRMADRVAVGLWRLGVRPARARAMMVFMICAVPSPIWKPSTSRRRCSIRPRS